MKTKFFKKIAASVLALTLVVSGVCCLETSGNEVQAAEGVSGQVVADYKNENTYPTEEGMVFAGWYTDSEYTEALTGTPKTDATYYAKFVPEEVLSVKFQFSTDGSKLRFISSVDTLEYQNVGFELTVTDGENVKTYVNSNTEVFKRINATDSTNAYKFSSKVIDTDSEYMITATWSGVTDTASYMVKPYWVTLDGTTVYGISRTVSFADYGKVNVAIEVEEEIAVGTDLKAAYGTENEATATVIGYDAPYAHVKINLGAAGLSSATTFTVSKTNGAELGTVVYRNLGTKYTGSGTEDTSWYTEYADETEFVIATVADLYGFATVVNDGRFATKTVYMCADMDINPTFDAGATTVTAPGNTWAPIGTKEAAFQGTFDGQGHTVKGIYVEGELSTDNIGMFGYSRDGEIKNFRLTNSYITGAATGAGSIVGAGSAELSNIYSAANMSGALANTGGIIGRATDSNETDAGKVTTALTTITNCWYAGSMNLSSVATTMRNGGIAGYGVHGTVKIISSLCTGTITVANDGNVVRIGGLVGENNPGVGIQLSDTLSTRTMVVTAASSQQLGGLIGRYQGGTATPPTVTNVYVTSEACLDDKTVGNWLATNNTYTTTPVDATELYGNGAANLSFGTYWTAREGKLPVLTSFADLAN